MKGLSAAIILTALLLACVPVAMADGSEASAIVYFYWEPGEVAHHYVVEAGSTIPAEYADVLTDYEWYSMSDGTVWTPKTVFPSNGTYGYMCRDPPQDPEPEKHTLSLAIAGGVLGLALAGGAALVVLSIRRR